MSGFDHVACVARALVHGVIRAPCSDGCVFQAERDNLNREVARQQIFEDSSSSARIRRLRRPDHFSSLQPLPGIGAGMSCCA